jgi:hypothetical protein
MYKAIQPLDYFSTELTAYIGILTHLAKWPGLVRVNFLFFVKFFSSNFRDIFKIIFRLSHPKTSSNRPARNPHAPSGGGRAFEDTLIGTFLSKSCLPSLPVKPYLFFEKPKVMTERDVELTAATMWQVRFNKKLIIPINFFSFLPI